jgi:hypothetical protein
LPQDLQRVVNLYLVSKSKLDQIKKSQEVESKVKEMCYDMILGVLEEHHLQAKAAIGFRPKALKHKSRVDETLKMSSINESQTLNTFDQPSGLTMQEESQFYVMLNDVPQLQ